MAHKEHHYQVQITWTGNTGTGTSSYRDYQRDYDIRAANKSQIAGSSDPSFRGDKTRWNPEDLLVASLSSCHQLWYLHLCSQNGIRVLEYVDEAHGVMTEDADGGAQFSQVTLKPSVVIAHGDDVALAQSLHHKANELCFVARSVNFPVAHKPATTVAQV